MSRERNETLASMLAPAADRASTLAPPPARRASAPVGEQAPPAAAPDRPEAVRPPPRDEPPVPAARVPEGYEPRSGGHVGVPAVLAQARRAAAARRRARRPASGKPRPESVSLSLPVLLVEAVDELYPHLELDARADAYRQALSLAPELVRSLAARPEPGLFEVARPQLRLDQVYDRLPFSRRDRLHVDVEERDALHGWAEQADLPVSVLVGECLIAWLTSHGVDPLAPADPITDP